MLAVDCLPPTLALHAWSFCVLVPGRLQNRTLGLNPTETRFSHHDQQGVSQVNRLNWFNDLPVLVYSILVRDCGKDAHGHGRAVNYGNGNMNENGEEDRNGDETRSSRVTPADVRTAVVLHTGVEAAAAGCNVSAKSIDVGMGMGMGMASHEM